MTKSEKIGYVFEYVCVASLEALGLSVAAHEPIDDSSIVADITVRKGGTTYVLFLTHTRTQGMTNRKFYRTFEELAQRRIKTPQAICIELSLFESGVRTPSQYGLLYDRFFDHSATALSSATQAEFVDFANELPDPVSMDVVSEHLGELSRPVFSRLRAVLKAALKSRRKPAPLVETYWNAEATVSPGLTMFHPNEQISVKLGLKLLALTDGTPLLGPDLTSETLVLKRKLSDDETRLLVARGLVTKSTPRLIGTALVLSPHLACAARALKKAGVTLPAGWVAKYLESSGAVSLYQQLINPNASLAVLESALKILNSVKNAESLARVWRNDLQSQAPRADVIDASLRVAGLSQNVLSTQTQEMLGIRIAQRNPMWFLIAKDDFQSVIPDVNSFVEMATRLVWEQMALNARSVDFWEFYRDRRKTFLSHRSVRPELILVDVATSGLATIGKKSRASVLPRVVSLPAKYSMSVQGAKRLELEDKTELFLVTISTPDPQHHKHKEFSGKLRAIRNSWAADTDSLVLGHDKFICVLDGAWNDRQVRMLSNSGWNVCGWEALPEMIDNLKVP